MAASRTAPRRAGVSSFGISGTNAHVILEQAPPARSPASEDASDEAAAVGRSSGAVWCRWPCRRRRRRRCGRRPPGCASTSLAHAELDLGDVGLVAGGDAVAVRAPGRRPRAGPGRAARRARGAGAGRRGRAERGHRGAAQGGTVRPVFVFPGQGSQWAGMARELLAIPPVFAERMRECADALSEFVEWDLFEELSGDRFDRVDVVQPVLFAVMVSLAAVWQSGGVKPAAVVGHSQGEIAAACVAGALTLRDAARVVALRSQAIRALSGKGGMVSVPLPADEVRGLITGVGRAGSERRRRQRPRPGGGLR